MSSLRSLADRVLQLAEAVSARQEIPDVQVFDVSWDWVYDKIRRLPPPMYVFRMDNKYRTTTLSEFRKIIEWEKVNLRRYIVEFWDCDDYAMRFKSNVASVFMINSVGFAVGLSYPECAHAYNILFAQDGTYVYEPQTDAIMTVEQARSNCAYAMEDYYIVL